MTKQEIKEHNLVNINRLTAKELDTFIWACHVHECHNGLFTVKSDMICKYVLCIYCESGNIIINGFNNRNRLRNLVKRYQCTYPDIKCKIIAEVIK